MPPSPTPPEDPEPRPPLGQRFFDNIFLLLAIGMLIMLGVYTGWGTWEIFSMSKATLP